MTIATGQALSGYSLIAYGWLLVVTLITQFMGHVPINVALRYMPATYLSLLLQLAVVLSGILAYFRFGETPNDWELAGGAVIIGGIVLAALSEGRRATAVARVRS